MGKWSGSGSGWLSFSFKHSKFLFSTKCVLLRATAGFRNNHKVAGRRDVLVSLYKDLESCQEYEDIQVMWAMVHSSACAPKVRDNTRRRSKRPSSSSSFWRFCFAPT